MNLPFKSKAQMRYFLANRERLEKQGVDVDEWLDKSKGKKLPERASKKKKRKKKGGDISVYARRKKK